VSIANRFRSVIQSLPLITLLAGVMTGSPILAVAAAPDPVLQWIEIMNNTVLAANSSPLVTTRVVALVSASVFDAVNGIHPGYKPLYVRPNAPGYASQSAAAVQAAYVVLSTLYPSQAASLGAERDASIAALEATVRDKSVQAGMASGRQLQAAFWLYARPMDSHRRCPHSSACSASKHPRQRWASGGRHRWSMPSEPVRNSQP
jgi:hypothetical protein